MRLLQAIAGARHGGAEAFFTRLALGLERAGQVQKIVLRRDRARATQLAAGGIDIVELRFGGRLDFTTRPALRRLLRQWQPDLVLTWMSRATRLMPRGSCPLVARLGGYYDLKYYRRADHLIGNTEDIVRYIVESGWPPSRAHYLPNFVEERQAAALSRAEIGVPEDAPVVLALGRLHRNKAFDTLLHALVEVPEAHLLIAGEGPERVALGRLTRRLGLAARVHLLGWRDDTDRLMAAADLVVLPSRHEPLGNVVIEAWAARVPIVAAAAEGPRALIRSGETGLLVPIDDAGALAGAIRGILASDVSAMVEAGYAAYLARFSEARVVDAYRDLLQRLAA